ncbi:MAG: patatin-like phospholipase family protein [Clostridia bacterium]
MLGLALEGGGAKGAYHVGAIKAFLENGYKFDAVTGASIGAINGALLAQGDFNVCLDFWEKIKFSMLFDFSDEHALHIALGEFKKDTMRYFFTKLRETIVNKGLDTTRYKEFLKKYIDEDKIRKSSIDLGIMTYSLSTLRPMPMFTEDIPKGKMFDYLVASANFPGFKRHQIDGKTYVDGGVYDNLPINMLINKGFTDIIAVHTLADAPKRKPKSKDINLRRLIPSEKPGRLLDFNNYSVSHSIDIGYYDGLRMVKGYKGVLYYFTDINYEILNKKLLQLPMEFYTEMCAELGIKEHEMKVLSMVDIVNDLAKKMDIKKFYHIAEVYIALVERVATINGVSRLCLINNLEELIKRTKENLIKNSENMEIKVEKKDEKIIRAFNVLSKYFI